MSILSIASSLSEGRPTARARPGFRSRSQACVRPASCRVARAAALCCLLIFIGGVLASAATLASYRSRVHQAAVDVQALAQWWKVDNSSQHSGRSEAVMSNLRQSLPPEETIEWTGGTAHVNNSWLHDELAKYQRLSPADAGSEDALLRIAERLSALEEHLAELGREGDGPQQGAAASKAEEKARLESILSRDEFAAKPPEDSWLSRQWERFKKWVRELFPDRNSLQPGQSSWLAIIAEIFVIGLALGLLSFIAWKVIPLLQRRGVLLGIGAGQGARVILGERLAPDQTAASILAEAEALARQGELRAAIRKGYIALLCELGDRKVLSLAQHKTNHDYLRAVRDRRPLLDQLQRLTNSFENHWYGFAPATENDWAAFRSGYQQALKVI